MIKKTLSSTFGRVKLHTENSNSYFYACWNNSNSERCISTKLRRYEAQIILASLPFMPRPGLSATKAGGLHPVLNWQNQFLQIVVVIKLFSFREN